MVSALANCLVNAIDAYQDRLGPIAIHVAPAAQKGYVVFCIRDEGCGMDEQTLRKAITPFFSFKPAGRKRGLGLSYAARVTRLNKGFLSIQSRLGEGTEVNITLPE
jgi:signal transduction histidine kinase